MIVNKVSMAELQRVANTPKSLATQHETFGTGPLPTLSDEQILQLVQEICRGEIGALRAFLEAMRQFTSTYIYEIGCLGGNAGPAIAQAFKDFEGMLIDMFRSRLPNNRAARPEESDPTDGDY
jgi:hypothetical protein